MEVPGDTSASGGIRVLPDADTNMIAGDAFDGASTLSREMASYAPAIRSADADIAPAKRMADARSRDTTRNDAYVQGGATLRKDNVVGSYYMLGARVSSKQLFGKEDTKWEDEYEEEVEEKFEAYAESIDNWPDAARTQTLTGLVRQAVDMNTVHGESLTSVEWLRDEPRPYHTAFQMIDTDRLGTPPEFIGDSNVSMGVRKNLFGAPQGYYVRMSHPAEHRRLLNTLDTKFKYQPIRTKWGRVQMIHIFDQLRPDQTRGIALMVAALTEMKMTKDFRKTVLQNAVVNATYAATIESDLPTEAIFQMLGGSDMGPAAVKNAIQSYMGAHFDTIGGFVGGSKNLNINGTKIPHLPPGSRLNLRGAGTGGPLGNDFEQSLLRHIAAALGVSYEQLSRDYTQTNYSSARAAMNETHKAMLSIKRNVADRLATNVYRLWLEEAINKGDITSLPRRAPSIYEGMNLDFYAGCDWVGASRGQIDELKETEAAVMRIENGLSDMKTENARLGADWRKRLRQMKREMEWKEFYGVVTGKDKDREAKAEERRASEQASEEQANKSEREKEDA